MVIINLNMLVKSILPVFFRCSVRRDASCSVRATGRSAPQERSFCVPSWTWGACREKSYALKWKRTNLHIMLPLKELPT